MRNARPYIKLAALVLLLGAVFFIAYRQGVFEYRDLSTLAAAIREVDASASVALLFVGIYTVAVAFGIPATFLTLAGGAIFGLVWGSALNWIGATLGASAAFGLARGLGSDGVRALLGRRAEKLDALTTEHGFSTVFRLRLIPVVPFNALNFSAGLADMDARDYVVASALGMLPGTIVYTYFADALLAGVAGAREDAFVHVAIAGGLLILLSFVPTIARKLGIEIPAPRNPSRPDRTDEDEAPPGNHR